MELASKKKFVTRSQCLVCSSSRLQPIRVEKNNKSHDERLSYYLNVDPVLVECEQCSFAFVETIPSNVEFYDAIYSDSSRDVSIDFLYSGKRRVFKQVLRALRPYAKRGSHLCDIGAGTGTFINMAKDEYQVSGVELSRSCSQYARLKGLSVETGDIEDLVIEDKKYDIITLIDVLEHLPEPKLSLHMASKILNKNGLIYIKVPSYKLQLIKQEALRVLGLSKSGIMQDYVHINHFSPQSLTTLLNNLGFEILESGGAESEIWDLTWSDAPKSVFYRRCYNFIVLSISAMIQNFLKLFGNKNGLNFYILARKK